MHENIYRGRAYRWVLAAVLTAMLCGCGGDDEEKSASQSPPGSTAPPPAPAPAPSPPPSSQARAATLEWTMPTTQTNGAVLVDLAGYRIHYGKSVSSLNTTIEIKNPSISTYVVEGLAPGTYYFAVTAFTSHNHESERSNAGMKQII
ncbi:MAG TPA: fibronectin type III domain-containing protein [Steroidobacteraceae bacterium]|nr:fibronectin type III domain-containing protein [Steroidobacteraceae bacterium]